MIILLFHKYILVPLWVLGKAESTAVMKPVLGLALTEPTARGKQRGMAQNDQAWDGGKHRGVRAGMEGNHGATGAQSQSGGQAQLEGQEGVDI